MSEAVSLAHLLGHAVMAEMKPLFTAGGMAVRADDNSDIVQVGQGVLDKVAAALEVPKSTPYDFTAAEVNMCDMMLQSLGWKPEDISRVNFVQRLVKVCAEAGLTWIDDAPPRP